MRIVTKAPDNTAAPTTVSHMVFGLAGVVWLLHFVKGAEFLDSLFKEVSASLQLLWC